MKDLVKRGVRVSIYTRPPRQMFDAAEKELDDNLAKGAADAIEYLKEIKVHVDLRPRMHEKLAVIDLKTCWVGSSEMCHMSWDNTQATVMRKS
ncbi:MAG: phospholipase D-like domain-containing protein [Candidatus Bathyarchaeia archaeon]